MGGAARRKVAAEHGLAAAARRLDVVLRDLVSAAAPMTPLVLLRHGPTVWTREHRLQGRVDLSLDDGGRAKVRGWRLAAGARRLPWLTSPLRRAARDGGGARHRRGAARSAPHRDGLGPTGRAAPSPSCAPCTATPWRSAEARGSISSRPAARARARFRQRLEPLLAEIAAADRPVGAVTHKGVIRALLALATGWDMRGKAPARLDWDAVHLFELDRAGRPAPLRFNLGSPAERSLAMRRRVALPRPASARHRPLAARRGDRASDAGGRPRGHRALGRRRPRRAPLPSPSPPC